MSTPPNIQPDAIKLSELVMKFYRNNKLSIDELNTICNLRIPNTIDDDLIDIYLTNHFTTRIAKNLKENKQ